ncbi:hypothetical protein JCM10296v2_006811 [Rhodotorula toruloides]
MHPPILSPTPFQTSRLVYRAVDWDKDESFFAQAFGHEATQLGTMGSMTRPLSKKALEGTKEFTDKALLSIIFCLPLSPEEPTQAGEAVGWVNLSMEEMDRRNQHRCAFFGLTVHPKHQGNGYGTEAMEWMLERAFVGFGLNRVQGNVFAWNKPAFRVYEKVGFVVEGRRRKALWIQGAWRDDLLIAILAEDWLARHPEKKPQVVDEV